MSPPQKTDEQLMASLLKELAEFRDLKDEVRDLTRSVNKLHVLEEKVIANAKELDKEIVQRQKFNSDFKDLKKDFDQVKGKVIYLDSEVGNHKKDLGDLELEITENFRVSQSSINSELEMSRMDIKAQKEIKKERNIQIVKIVFTVIAAIVSFIVGHFLK